MKKCNKFSDFFVDMFDICRIYSMAIELGDKEMPKSRKTKGKKPQINAVELTEAEWDIMKVVWDKEPCAAGTVQETLAKSRDRAYSTVKTTMDRMVEKGFLEIEKIRNLQLFKSCISEVDARRGEFRRMLKRAFDGALTPMMQFLIEHEGLSIEEASQLRELVDKQKKGKSEK
jgi:BlaI family penicillinase repressor